ncbi:MAG: hypothetical protein EOP88_11965, partial [Verrucomicrobiaceae bacterium]
FTSFGVIDGPRALRSDGPVVLAARSRTRVTDHFSIGLKNSASLDIRDSAVLNIEGSGHLNIGDTGTGDSVMRMSGGTVTTRQLFVGKNAGTSGVLLQSGGLLAKVKSPALVDTRIGGGVEGSAETWGAWRMTGGEYTDNWNLQVGSFGVGIVEVDGGKIEVDGFLGIGRYEDDMRNAARGLLDVKSGSVTMTGAGRLLLVGEEGIGVLNIRGGLVDCINRMVIGAGTIAKPGEGTVNLLTGGTLLTNGIGQYNQTEAFGRMNFDGGTLKARGSAMDFLKGIDYAYVRKGGANIDTAGHDVEIGQALVAPRGNGIARIPVVDGGSGYLAPPWIEISGGAGAGATAIAELEGGMVKGITITHAGNDFLSPPTVTVMGGGAGKGLVIGTPVLAVNTSGGLVKTGEGTLTLSGANTYPGPTQVKEGKLRLTSQIAGVVQIAAGATFGGRGTAGSVAVAANGTLSPDVGNVLTIRGNSVIKGTLALNISAAGTGRLDTGGKLDLKGSKLLVTSSVPSPGSPAHIIASYGSLEGEFSASEIPAGYTLDYHHNGGNQIALVAAAARHDEH